MSGSITPTAGMQALIDPALDPLFRVPLRTGVGSAWWEHVPFAALLVTQMRPGTVVELGSYLGVSFAALCDAMQRASIPGRCYAVDTWQGDHHAGFYGEEVFRDLSDFIAMRYKHCGELIRLQFDDALQHFADGSIDLLHIDGLHTYEAVKHDFESWKPKLSERGVVLFHDTNVRRGDFGVYRLWEEIRDEYPSFEFLHGYGLGVLAVGPNRDPFVASLCDLGPQSIHVVRERIAWLGARWTSASRERQLIEVTAELERVRSAVSAHAAELDRARSAQSEQAAELDRVRSDASHQAAGHAAELGQAHALLAGTKTELDSARSRAAAQDADLIRAQAATEERSAAIGEIRAALSESERRVAELELTLSQSTANLAIHQGHIANFQVMIAEYDQHLRKALKRDYIRRIKRLFRRKRS